MAFRMALRLLFLGCNRTGNRDSMKKPLRILHLEDDPDFSALVRALLEREAIPAELCVVSMRADFEKALGGGNFDVILADYLLPEYNGIEALRCARTKCPQTPFLLVSGTIGEQAAIESLKSGATDYVLKMLPERLVPAIRRAVQEAEDRTQRRKVETELVRREKYFRTLTENALDIVTALNREGRFLYNSPAIQRVLGYEPSELAGQEACQFVNPEERLRVQKAIEDVLEKPERTLTLEFRFQHRDGSWRHLEAVGRNRLEDPGVGAIVVNSRDITERKRVEHRDAAFSKLGQRLSSATSPEEAAEIIRAVTDDLFPWDTFSLDLYSTEDQRVHPILNVDTNQEGQRFEIPTSSLGREPSGMARRIVERGAEVILREAPLVMP